MMIKSVVNENDIVKVWQEAFGDSIEDILFFIHNLKHGQCIGFYGEQGIQSIMFLVECLVDGCKGRYVYAACTKKEYRRSGCMTDLLSYAKDNCDDFLCLIPADKPLIDYYKKRGFVQEINIDSIIFDESNEITDYLFEGCSLAKPIALKSGG